MPLNEADTCRVYITPALQRAGWGDPVWRLAEQHYFTDGQIVLVGDGHKRQKGKKADYLLRYEESLPIAVVEAKAEDLEPGAGLQQSKDYAQILGVLFAYATNGHGIEEWDFTTIRSVPSTLTRRRPTSGTRRPGLADSHGLSYLVAQQKELIL